LGVILYELLTGQHPFGKAERRVIMERIATYDARPPRQLVNTIPDALERINMRALERWTLDRYATAREFAEDLRWFVEQFRARESSGQAPPVPHPRTPSVLAGFEPKGLRSFDKHDAEAFLEFLPGPRDRHGMAEAIRFWKVRVEETSAQEALPIGLIYGPSGCGKSSLVKAGLIPRLDPRIIPVYLEATGEDLEARLLARLRGEVPGLDTGLELAETLATIRRSTPSSPGSKVLIVLDQFEQWLHTNRERQETGLVRALRQCDGIRLQTIVLIRDDFWMATSRFMKELEVRIEDGRNAAAVDRFHLPHAHKVLATLGGAF
ncbi:nSTAND1 domain-containing NTPase, partial [Singulisphaera rosea]